jgi:hypothetical protein
VNLPLAVLPYAPPPHTDELLSSWIERLGHFYGIGYLGARVILEPSRAANKRGVNEDLDSSESIRNAAILWSGFAERLMPPVVPMDDTVLEASARLAYCAECWNEDVERGQSPYIRRKWINWLCVACSEHGCWLNAREPHVGYGSELNGWAPVWQSNANWAQAAHVPYEPALLSFALGLESNSISLPNCSWASLEADFESLVHENRLVLRLMGKPEYGGMFHQVFQALEVGSRNPRITDAHLRGYGRSRPGWIAARIGCVVAAVEIVRIVQDRQPAIEIAKRTIEGYPGARHLVDECRELQSQSSWQFQSQNSCQFGTTTGS